MSITKTYYVWEISITTSFSTRTYTISPGADVSQWTFQFADDTLGDAPTPEVFYAIFGDRTVPFTYQGTAEVDGTTGFVAIGGDYYHYLTESPRLDLKFKTVAFTEDTVGPGGAEYVVCFFPGCLIATPVGENAVEALAIGDLVLTHDGRAAPIRWIGRQTVSTRFADPNRVLPIRIRAGALGGGLPKRDLLVSPGHALLVDGILVQAGALVNGSSIVRERDVPEVFTYHHIELDTHALLLAEGTPAESYVDNASCETFDNGAEREALGRAPIAEMDRPRATSARQVPGATRRRLDDIARDLGLAAAAAA